VEFMILRKRGISWALVVWAALVAVLFIGSVPLTADPGEPEGLGGIRIEEFERSVDRNMARMLVTVTTDTPLEQTWTVLHRVVDWDEFIGLFLVSAVGWWVFEFFNRYLQNWEYLGTGKMSVLKYAVVATLHFTTVTPAIFETAELWSTTGFVQQFRGRRRVELTGTLLSNAIFFGVLAVVAVITVPRYAFPLVWLSVLLILDPLNYLREQPSLLAKLQKGDWRPVIALMLSGITCGFFWEMWNYYAMPKWVYHVPFVSVLRVFEMPLLGYGGYLPFALEVYAFYHFLLGLLGVHQEDYVQLV